MPVKVKDAIKLIETDGWFVARQKGSHRQYKHSTKKGLVTISCHSLNDDLSPKTYGSIIKQAGLKED